MQKQGHPVSLAYVYAENAKFSEPAYLGWDRSRPHTLLRRLSLYRLRNWEMKTRTFCYFRDAVDLLSSKLNILDDYVSFLVVKCRKPSKTSRCWMYYTFGAIGVSVFSLWLLRHGRLSGVIHNWVFEAKESVTGLLIDPVKQLTLVNRRHKELMKLKQVLSTRDFRVIAIIIMD
nr:hypothetical protein [Tanacetum cinerariifolium]